MESHRFTGWTFERLYAFITHLTGTVDMYFVRIIINCISVQECQDPRQQHHVLYHYECRS